MSVPDFTTDLDASPYDDQPLIIAHGDCKTTRWTRAVASWSDVCSWVDLPGDTKECGGYVLGSFAGEGDVARSKETFQTAWAVKLDVERKNGVVDEEIVDKLESLNLDAIAHTTASSTTEAPRWRFLILASRPMSREVLRLVTRGVEDELGAENFDKSAGEGERFMFRPAKGKDGSYQSKVMYGEPLDVDMWIERGRELEAEQNVINIATGEPTTPAEPLTPAETTAWTREVTEFLDELRNLGTGESVRYHGKHVGWDTGAWFAAIDLAKIVNSSEDLTLQEARELFLKHAPNRDEGFNPLHKWESGVRDAGTDTVRRTDNPAAARQDLGYNPYSTHDADLASNLAERGLAERFRFAPEFGWCEWDGKRWDTNSPTQRVMKAITNMIPGMLAEWAKKGLKAEQIGDLARARNSTKTKQILAALEAELLVRGDQFDQHPMLLNVKNGTVDLLTGKLREHRRGDLITKITDVAYQAGATHEDWDTVLEAFGDRETIDWMQLRIGQAATGHHTQDGVIPIMGGGGENGKSAIIDSLKNAFGEYGLLVSDRVLIGGVNNHPTEVTELRGARFAYVEELPEGRHLNVAAVKKITDSPEITGRRMHKDSIRFTPSHSLFITTNYDVQIAETDHGTWRRFARVTFPFTYVKANPKPGTLERQGDRTLKSRMAAGGERAEAVLAWIVAGAVRVYGELGGIIPLMPSRVEESTNEWRQRSDAIYAYVSERLVEANDVAIRTDDLFNDFTAWNEQRGGQAWRKDLIASRLEGHTLYKSAGISKTAPRTRRHGLLSQMVVPQPQMMQSRATFYVGVRFRSDMDDDL